MALAIGLRQHCIQIKTQDKKDDHRATKHHNAVVVAVVLVDCRRSFECESDITRLQHGEDIADHSQGDLWEDRKSDPGFQAESVVRKNFDGHGAYDETEVD